MYTKNSPKSLSKDKKNKEYDHLVVFFVLYFFLHGKYPTKVQTNALQSLRTAVELHSCTIRGWTTLFSQQLVAK